MYVCLHVYVFTLYMYVTFILCTQIYKCKYAYMYTRMQLHNINTYLYNIYMIYVKN